MNTVTQTEGLTEITEKLEALFGSSHRTDQVSVHLNPALRGPLGLLQWANTDRPTWHPFYVDSNPCVSLHFERMWQELDYKQPDSYHYVEEREIDHQLLWRLTDSREILMIYLLDGPRIAESIQVTSWNSFKYAPVVRAVLAGQLLPTGQISLSYIDQACPGNNPKLPADWGPLYEQPRYQYTYSPLLVAGTMFYYLMYLLLIEQKSLGSGNWEYRLAMPCSLEKSLQDFFQTHLLLVNGIHVSAASLVVKEDL